MKNICIPLFLLAVTVALGGCSSGTDNEQAEQQAISHATAPFAQGAITLNINAEPNMNTVNDVANSCTVLLLQAQNNEALEKLLASPIQIKNLFNGAESPEEILKIDRYTAMPGQQTTLHIDRSENTRSVAIIAGYYPFPGKKHIVSTAIPVTTLSEGWWAKKWSAELAPLSIKITLGSQSITQFQGIKLSPAALSPDEPAIESSAPDNLPLKENNDAS